MQKLRGEENIKEINMGGELIEKLREASLLFNEKVEVMLEKLKAKGNGRIALTKLYDLLEENNINSDVIGVPITDFNFIINALNGLVNPLSKDDEFEEVKKLIDDMAFVLNGKRDVVESENDEDYE